MADRIRFGVSLTPLETLTDENGGTRDIVASEVGRSLSGSGESIAISDYSGTAANQGFKDAAVNYKIASHSAGGTILTGTNLPDFIYIKNTGYKFSSATALGISTTDCISVAIRIDPQAGSGGNAGWVDYNDTQVEHFIEIAWLKPGQAIALPLGSASVSISQFGSVANDFSPLAGSAPANANQGILNLVARTYLANGSAASSGNAVEYLVVT